MRVKVKYLPQDIIAYFNLQELVTEDGYVYMKIDKSMYRLRNAAIMMYNNLKAQLKPFGYYPVEVTT